MNEKNLVFLVLCVIGVQCANVPQTTQNVSPPLATSTAAQPQTSVRQPIPQDTPAQGLLHYNDQEMYDDHSQANGYILNDPILLEIIGEVMRQRNLLRKYGTNSIRRIGSNVGSVTGGLDTALSQKSALFNRLNDKGSNLFGQAIATTGTALAIPPTIGYKVLGTAEDFMLDPRGTVWNLGSSLNPFRSSQIDFNKEFNRSLLDNLRKNSPYTFYKLRENKSIHNLLKQNPNLYQAMLQNPVLLEDILNDPRPLFQFMQNQQMPQNPMIPNQQLLQNPMIPNQPLLQNPMIPNQQMLQNPMNMFSQPPSVPTNPFPQNSQGLKM